MKITLFLLFLISTSSFAQPLFTLSIKEGSLGHTEKEAKTHNQVCKFMVDFGGLYGDATPDQGVVPTAFHLNGLVPNSEISIDFSGIPTGAIIGVDIVQCYRNGKWEARPALKFILDHGKLKNNCDDIFYGPQRNCEIKMINSNGNINYRLIISDK